MLVICVIEPMLVELKLAHSVGWELAAAGEAGYGTKMMLMWFLDAAILSIGAADWL